MLYKWFLTIFSLVTSHFQAPVDDEYPYVIPDDITYDETPQGPQSWEEIEKAAHALYGHGSDILYPEGNGRSNAGIKGKSYRWPNKTVPLVLSRDVINDKPLLQKIDKVFRYFKKETGIKFVPKTNEKEYALIYKNGKICNSYLGFLHIARQPVSLGEGCEHEGIIMHEFGHLLGMDHEHQRSDRDLHVIVYPQNVKPGDLENFVKTNPNEEVYFGLPYNPLSIMHYGEYAYSKDIGRLKTMEAKDGRPLLEPWQKKGLTPEDKALLVKMYS